MFSFNPVSNKFQPTNGETYRYIGVPTGHHTALGLLIGRRVWRGNNSDKYRLSINNVFKTIGEAKAVRAQFVSALKSAQR